MAVKNKSMYSRNWFIRIFLKLFSRNLFFQFFSTIEKVCHLALNRTAATFFVPEHSGEGNVLDLILSRHQREEAFIVFDIGGNDGLYTKMVLDRCVNISQKVDIHVFEPSSQCLTVLKEHFSESRCVHLNAFAVSDSDCTANLYFPWEGACGASLNEMAMGIQLHEKFEVKAEEVSTITLDHYCRENQIDKIHFLKIDIEGFELRALNGAKVLLHEKRIQVIQMEHGVSSIATRLFFRDLWMLLNADYEIFLILNQDLHRIKNYKSSMECFYGASNYLAILRS